MDSTPTTSADLLRAALLVRGWSRRDLRHQLAARNVEVSRETIRHWCEGEGIADRYRLALCDLLGIDLGVLARALATRAA